MTKERPLGITFYGVLFVSLGGFFTFIIFLEMIDSIQYGGIQSILINTPESFAGFLFYGLLPVVCYFLGAGIMAANPWARLFSIYIFPVLSLFWFMNFSANFARKLLDIDGVSFLEIVFAKPHIMLQSIIIYLAFIVPLWIYFHNDSIVDFFFGIDLESK